MPTTLKKRRQRRSEYPVVSDPFFEIAESVSLLEQAVEGNQRQINEVSRNTSNAIKEVTALIEKQGAQTGTRLEALAESFQASQKPNYMLWLAAIAVFFTLISAGWKITDLQTQVTMAPTSAKAEVSERDRGELHREVAEIRGTVAQIEARQKGFGQQLQEVETQFRMSDKTHNIQFAEQQRMNSLVFQLAQKKNGEPIVYPTAPFYFPETAIQDGIHSQQ